MPTAFSLDQAPVNMAFERHAESGAFLNLRWVFHGGTLMRQSTTYLLLCIIGIVVPWFFLIGFLGEPGPKIGLFFSSIFSNQVTSSVATDLLISALVFLVFVFFEGRRLNMSRLWVFIPATLLIGLSFGLPLFLYFRARHIEKMPNPAFDRDAPRARAPQLER